MSIAVESGKHPGEEFVNSLNLEPFGLRAGMIVEDLHQERMARFVQAAAIVSEIDPNTHCSVVMFPEGPLNGYGLMIKYGIRDEPASMNLQKGIKGPEDRPRKGVKGRPHQGPREKVSLQGRHIAMPISNVTLFAGDSESKRAVARLAYWGIDQTRADPWADEESPLGNAYDHTVFYLPELDLQLPYSNMHFALQYFERAKVAPSEREQAPVPEGQDLKQSEQSWGYLTIPDMRSETFLTLVDNLKIEGDRLAIRTFFAIVGGDWSTLTNSDEVV